MAIPELDNEGFLPPGVHDCTLDEIRERFGRCQNSDCRPRLYGKLETFVSETRRANLAASLIVNGSFITAKSEPRDIDLVVVLPADHNFGADLGPDGYNTVSSRRVAKRYGFDILVAAEGTIAWQKFVELFQRVKERADRKKGLLRLEL